MMANALESADHALRLSDVRKTFTGHVAVAGLSLDVPRGGVFGLLGRTEPARPRPCAWS